jgi:creatinine amidohydrolase
MGVQEVMLFSGHFADEQLHMIDDLATAWNAERGLPLVKAFAVNRADVPTFPPDHAGLFETTLLAGLAEGLIDLSRLGPAADAVDRFDPASPLWGIVGSDPRQLPPLDRATVVKHVVKAISAFAGPTR